MINQEEIINNANACAEQDIENHFKIYSKAKIGDLREQMTEEEFREIESFVYVSAPARTRKECHVSFRNVDLNILASKTRAFQSLHHRISLYSLQEHGRHDESTTLAFLADCMMIKHCGRARPPQMSKLPKAMRKAIRAIHWDVLEIFHHIASTYGRSYLEDMQDKTLELASEVVSAKSLPLAA